MPELERASARSYDSAQDDARSLAVQPDSSAAGFNDPVTTSRASACPRSDATALTVKSSIRGLPFPKCSFLQCTTTVWMSIPRFR